MAGPYIWIISDRLNSRTLCLLSPKADISAIPVIIRRIVTEPLKQVPA
jgi:hypothetical protein